VKPVPVIVTRVPPVSIPLLGLMLVTVGASAARAAWPVTADSPSVHSTAVAAATMKRNNSLRLSALDLPLRPTPGFPLIGLSVPARPRPTLPSMLFFVHSRACYREKRWQEVTFAGNDGVGRPLVAGDWFDDYAF
jgi:hypothetical protein